MSSALASALSTRLCHAQCFILRPYRVPTFPSVLALPHAMTCTLHSIHIAFSAIRLAMPSSLPHPTPCPTHLENRNNSRLKATVCGTLADGGSRFMNCTEQPPARLGSYAWGGGAKISADRVTREQTKEITWSCEETLS